MVVANTRTKSIQKQIESIDVDKVGSKNLKRVNPVSCKINRLLISSLRSRRLEVVGEREHVFSCAHFFQAPARQATSFLDLISKQARPTPL